MAYDFAAKARHKAMNEKKASKKTQVSLFNAYKVMRERNDERNSATLVQLREERIQGEASVEEVQSEDTEG